ncbi:MAG: hypothetical protein RL459_1856 [Pseudomonadota bacterium]|jgi:KDO2-lipid IV(A) lauroyltransferase
MSKVLKLASQFWLLCIRLMARLPLPWLRALGAGLGYLLYAAAVPRRHVVMTNLRLCFPLLSPAERRRLARSTFVRFAQALLDRGWLWHGSPELLRQRIRLTGALAELQSPEPVLIFAPHFVGLDAGWTALTQQVPRRFNTIYTHQANRTVDAWIFNGRQRFGQPRLFDRSAGPKPLVSALREGEALYLLPDMNFGIRESVFVPFYGVPAATVTSLGRFSRLGNAKVVPVVTCMQAEGYEVKVLPAWADFPTQDASEDAAQMNLRLQQMIDTMPDQYYWVHKRFKSRPPGNPSVY